MAAFQLGTEAVAGSKNQVGEWFSWRIFHKVAMFVEDFMCSKWNILVRVSKFEAMY